MAGVPIAAIGEPEAKVVSRVKASLGPPKPRQDFCLNFKDETWGDLSLQFTSKKLYDGYYFNYTAASASLTPSPLLKVTTSGITLGDTEARARAAYPRVPRGDYVPNDYLVVPPQMVIRFGTDDRIYEIYAEYGCAIG
jgi:hypothetical protein